MLATYWEANYNLKSALGHLRLGGVVAILSLIFALADSGVSQGHPYTLSWIAVLMSLGSWAMGVLSGIGWIKEGKLRLGQFMLFVGYFIPISSLMGASTSLATSPLNRFFIGFGAAGVVIGLSMLGALYLERSIQPTK